MSARSGVRTLPDFLADIDERLRRVERETASRPALPDHGDLPGLQDDDHPYIKESEFTIAGQILVGIGNGQLIALDVPADSPGAALVIDETVPWRLAWSAAATHTHDGTEALSTVLGGTSEQDPGKAIAYAGAVAGGDYAIAGAGGLALGMRALAGQADNSDGFNAIHLNVGDGGGWARGNRSFAAGYGAIADGDDDFVWGFFADTGFAGEGSSLGENILITPSGGAVDAGKLNMILGGASYSDGAAGDPLFANIGNIVISTNDVGSGAAHGQDNIVIGPASGVTAQAFGRDLTAIGTGDIEAGDAQAWADYLLGIPGAFPTSESWVGGHDAQVLGSRSAVLGVSVGLNRTQAALIGVDDGPTILPFGIELGELWIDEDFTADGRAFLYNVDADGGNRIATLTAIDAINDDPEDFKNGFKRGTLHAFKKIDASANTVTIDPGGTDTIEGQSSIVLTDQYDYVILQAVNIGVAPGTNYWTILGSQIGGPPGAGSGHTIKEDGTPLTTRAGLNFVSGIIATDDAGNNETDINIDYASTTELADVAVAEVAGTSPKIPRGDHVHAHGSGYLPDAHHAQSHGAADHSGDVLPDGANQGLGAAYIDIAQIAAPADPASGTRRLFVDSSDGKIKVRTSAGASVSLEEQGGGGGSVATDTIWDAKGDLAVGTGADTAARLAVGSDETIVMADASTSTGLKWASPATTSELANVAEVESAGTSDTWPRGDHVHGIADNAIAASKIKAEAWTAYDPAWTATVSNPLIGNGTKNGRYFVSGKLLYISIRVDMGSTTTYGSGNWRFGLPPGLTTTGMNRLLDVMAFDTSASSLKQYLALSNYASSSTLVCVKVDGTQAEFGSTQPFTWASGDSLWIHGILELA